MDPNDISSFTVLKSAAATTVYGMRAAAGVILIATTKGSQLTAINTTYQSYIASASLSNALPSMSPKEYVSAWSNDMGYETHWLDEVAQSGFSQVHNLSVSGGVNQTTFRFAFNNRNVNSILKKIRF